MDCCYWLDQASLRSPAPEGCKVRIPSRSSCRRWASPHRIKHHQRTSRPADQKSPAWSSHWRCHPGRTTGDDLRALSPRARAPRCAGFGRLCLHSQPHSRMAVSMGSIKWKVPADFSVRTAEIGGRRRQAQDDHQGRLGCQLAVGVFDSRPRDPLLRKAVAERPGEKVCRQDDLREVTKSAVRADTPGLR